MTLLDGDDGEEKIAGVHAVFRPLHGVALLANIPPKPRTHLGAFFLSTMIQ